MVIGIFSLSNYVFKGYSNYVFKGYFSKVPNTVYYDNSYWTVNFEFMIVGQLCDFKNSVHQYQST